METASSEYTVPTDYTTVITIRIPKGPYTFTREKPAIKDENGGVIGYERGKLTIELPANVDVSFNYEPK